MLATELEVEYQQLLFLNEMSNKFSACVCACLCVRVCVPEHRVCAPVCVHVHPGRQWQTRLGTGAGRGGSKRPQRSRFESLPEVEHLILCEEGVGFPWGLAFLLRSDAAWEGAGVHWPLGQRGPEAGGASLGPRCSIPVRAVQRDVSPRDQMDGPGPPGVAPSCSW